MGWVCGSAGWVDAMGGCVSSGMSVDWMCVWVGVWVWCGWVGVYTDRTSASPLGEALEETNFKNFQRISVICININFNVVISHLTLIMMI